MVKNDWLEIIRGLIRPYISVTGWTAFLIVSVMSIIKFMDSSLARELTIGFLASVSTIVGVWLGSRSKK